MERLLWFSILLPRPAEEFDEVLAHDPFDVRLAVASLLENLGDFVYVGDRIEIFRRLLFAEASIEVRADAAVLGIAGELANVVDVVDQFFERDIRLFGFGHADRPAGGDHPRVEDRTNNGTAFDQFLELVVIELTVVGGDRPAIVMAGNDRAVVNF